MPFVVDPSFVWVKFDVWGTNHWTCWLVGLFLVLPECSGSCEALKFCLVGTVLAEPCIKLV